MSTIEPVAWQGTCRASFVPWLVAGTAAVVLVLMWATSTVPNGEGEVAKAGRYDLVGRNGKVTSEPTPFALTNAS